MNLKDQVYVERLENLILYTLIPIYTKYYAKSSGFEIKRPLDDDLISEIKNRRKKVAALFRENNT